MKSALFVCALSWNRPGGPQTFVGLPCTSQHHCTGPDYSCINQRCAPCKDFNFLCKWKRIRSTCQGPAKYFCPLACHNCEACFRVSKCVHHITCGFCGKCSRGFYATPDGVCSRCSQVVPNCKRYANCGVCGICANGYEITPAGTCSVCTTALDNCKEHDRCDVCRTCADGYRVDSNGACVAVAPKFTIPDATMVGLAGISRLKMTDLLETTCQNGGTYKLNVDGIEQECGAVTGLCDELVATDAANACADNGYVQQCCRQSCGFCVPVPWRLLPVGFTVCWTYTRYGKVLQEISCEDGVDVKRVRCCDSTACDTFDRDARRGSNMTSMRTHALNYILAVGVCKQRDKNLCTLQQAMHTCIETERGDDTEPIILHNPAAVECYWSPCVAADEWCPIGEYEAGFDDKIAEDACRLPYKKKLCCREPDDARTVVKWLDIDALINRFPSAASADGRWDVFDFLGAWADVDILILFELTDTNGDGWLTRDEMRVFTAKHISFFREVTMQNLRFYFNRLDGNEDGQIQWNEVVQALWTFRLQSVNAYMMLSRWDTSGDGGISWNEFLYGLGVAPPAMWLAL